MGRLVVIGNFDGVHRGHQALLEGAMREGTALGLSVMLLTFEPHPALTLGRMPPPLLTRSERKRELIRHAWPDIEIVEQPFDTTFAAQSPLEFATRLRTEHDARRVVVGQNFRFGKGRAGDFATLGELGRDLGFDARSMPMTGDAAGPWSSTRARAAIAAGDLAEAERTLGRPHMVSGRVIRQKQLGRTLGFPTANLAEVTEALPPLGVYATLVDQVDAREGVRALGIGATSIGKNPTTDAGDEVKVETYVLDFDGDLYDAELRVHLLERLREEVRFDGLEPLVQQMREDVNRARVIGTAYKSQHSVA